MRSHSIRRRTGVLVAGLLAVTASASTASAADPEFDAEVRVREYVSLNEDFDGDADDANNFAVMRTSVGMRFEAGEYARAYVQFRDTRGLGEPVGTTTSLEQLDLHQGYLDLERVYDSPLTFRIGRQEMSFGAQRQVGAFDWDDVGRSFDGIRMIYDIEDFGWLHTFAMKINETGYVGSVNSGANITDSGEESAFFGAYLHYAPDEITTIEAYFFDLYEDRGTDDFGAVIVEGNTGNLYTAGGRVVYDSEDLGLKLYGEGALQFGSAPQVLDPMDLTATVTPDYAGYAMVAGADYRFPTETHVWLGLEFNLASGDDTPDDPAENGTYRQLFPDPHGPLGYFDYVGWQNVMALRGRFGVKPNEQWKLWVDYHAFQVAQETDGWYDASGALRLAGGQGFDSALGSEIDASVKFTVDENLSFLGVFGMWMPGDWQNQAAAQANGAADPIATPEDLDSAFRVYLQTTATF